jgi:hypothetical protein
MQFMKALKIKMSSSSYFFSLFEQKSGLNDILIGTLFFFFFLVAPAFGA